MGETTESLKKLRELRSTVNALNSTMVADLEPFLQNAPGNGVTFRRLPYSDLDEKSSKDVGVTVTCTVLMALATTGRLTDFYEAKNEQGALLALDQILSAPWKSSGLEEANKFTQILVLRTAGILAQEANIKNVSAKIRDGKQARKKVDARKHLKSHAQQYKDDSTDLLQTENKTLREIAKDILVGKYEDEDARPSDAPPRPAPESITLGRYPASSALAYWFIDALDLLEYKLSRNQWTSFATWASREFSHQVSLVASSHDAMMDPIGMAMAACLAARLRKVAPRTSTRKAALTLSELPSAAELRNGLRVLIGKQQPSGIWAKYFPMFQYLDDSGANYCFSFEMLEAILNELGRGDEEEDIFSDQLLFDGFEKSVEWIKHNRLTYHFAGIKYVGWNSGGQVQTLSKGVPESWATAVVHMFLFRLEVALSLAIKRRLLRRYDAQLPVAKKAGPDWDGILDIDVTFPHEKGKATIKKVLETEIIDKVRKAKKRNATKEASIDHRLSALLFGPPGTSKTTLVRQLAREIGWRYIEITPSHFLSRGLEQIYGRSDEIFEDLLDLSQVVILFDEMDALVQRRDPRRDGAGSVSEQPLDVTRQFLTTSMLPKLARLHDHKRALFFMATNHQRSFDSAIKRPGRFDLLLCMGPPTWEEKLAKIETLLPRSLRDNGEGDAIAGLLKKRVNHRARGQLNRFTFGEVKSLLEHLCIRKNKDPKKLKEVLSSASLDEISGVVDEWAKDLITLSDAPETKSVIEEYEEDTKASRRQ